MELRCDVPSLLLAVASAIVLPMSIANAQTCAAPGSWNPDATGAPPVNADLCVLPDSVSLYCDFLDSAGKNDAIYQLTLPPAFTNTSISISGGAAGFNPVIFLYTGTCANGNNCVQSGDTNNPLPLTGVTPGTYFLAATAAPSDATGACGTITMTTNAVPVELQSFEVD
jgi:hypothetical protein